MKARYFALVFGVWAIIAYHSRSCARLFARSLAIFFGVLTILGLIPLTSTLFGLIPLFGHHIWLHALTALIAAYFGFRARTPGSKECYLDALPLTGVSTAA